MLNRLKGKPVLAFIQATTYQPARARFLAVVPATQDLESAIHRELDRQADIVNQFEQITREVTKTDMYATVKKLIGKLSNKEMQDGALSELESLGDPAIPAIVCLMDNETVLGKIDLSFANHASNAFEGRRHVSAGTVFDALNCLLEQETYCRFADPVGSSSNPEATRELQKKGWQIVCHKYMTEGNEFKTWQLRW